MTVPNWTADGSPFPPVISTYVGSETKTIAVWGDSVAGLLAPQLQSVLAQTGRTATIENFGRPSTTPCDWNVTPFSAVVAAWPQVDIWIGHFVGNQELVPANGPVWEDMSPPFEWYTANTEAMAAMDAVIAATGKSRYWCVPAPSWVGCLSAAQSFETAIIQAFADQYVRTMHNAINLRDPFGGDTFYQTFAFPSLNGIWADLRPGTETTPADCTHYTSLGATMACWIIAGAIQNEWADTVSEQ